MNPLSFFILPALALTLPIQTQNIDSQSTSRPIKTWSFTKTTPDDPSADWKTVSVPHCWNAQDAQKGGGKEDRVNFGFYRGPGTYKTTLPASIKEKGKQTYLRLNGVSNFASVYINNIKIGEHSGAFGSFGWRITDHLRKDQPNTIEVRATNAYNGDILPISGDFPVYGGMYRPVTLEIRPSICFSPVKDGSWGIQTKQFHEGNNVRLEISANIENSTGTESPGILTFELKDKQGKIVASSEEKINFREGEQTAACSLSIKKPHLWNGIEDPYLYTLTASLKTPNKIIDRAKPVKIGFRTVEFSPSEGFKLNGKTMKIFGVCRHQDKEDKGWALSHKDHLQDVKLMQEIGANAVRLAHYPQSEEILDALDEAGILVWAEIPYVDSIGKPKSANVEEVTKNQLKEMIRQQINHPSIIVWGLSNELGQRATDDPVPLLRELNTLAHQEDSTRKTVCAVNRPNDMNLCSVTDVYGVNTYPGWYGGPPESMEGSIKNLRSRHPNTPWSISEYGSGASLKHHDRNISKGPNPSGKWHPEEWQCRAHEKNWEKIIAQDATWGSFIWNMFDFASAWRDEGDRPGINDKGLITFDRSTKKDAFYFYQANWRKDIPVLHLQTRRATPTKDQEMTIRFYSNMKSHKVLHNGKQVGKITSYAPNSYQTAPITLLPGKNIIAVQGTTPSGKKDTDQMVIVKE